MKKIAIGALAVCLLTACTNINKDELKQEIKENLKKEMAETYPKVVKGDGSYFYNESPFQLAVRNFYTSLYNAIFSHKEWCTKGLL